MASSSLVGMTQMVTAESGVEMMRGSLERVAFCGAVRWPPLPRFARDCLVVRYDRLHCTVQ